jgi:hypothetical protein
VSLFPTSLGTLYIYIYIYIDNHGYGNEVVRDREPSGASLDPRRHGSFQNAQMNYKPRVLGLQPFNQQLIGNSVGIKQLDEPRQPRLEDLGVSQLLRDDADAGFQARIRIVLGLGTPEPADVGTGRDEGIDQRLVVDAIASHNDVEALAFTWRREGQRRGGHVCFPVQRGEVDPGPRPLTMVASWRGDGVRGPGFALGRRSRRPGCLGGRRGRFVRVVGGVVVEFVFGDVLLHELGDVVLVGQDHAGYPRREEQADQGGDAAAQLNGERGRTEKAMGEERVVVRGADPFGKQRCDFPDNCDAVCE